ncbi:hypothetical protein GCM10025857_04110 [Alicyclobacillus contaminans]|nr:hypothetical protein GCM10025857_04110 [Alicyclobacillus contaminans]
MNIHEYQAKSVLAQYGVAVPTGKVAFTVDEAVAAAQELGGQGVVKAQIHAGDAARQAASSWRGLWTKSGSTLRTCSGRPWSRIKPARRGRSSSGC